MAENNKLIYFAMAANGAIAVAKFVAGIAGGSSSLLAEGFHSVADTGDQAMLLLGRSRSKRPPDELHPFGHGKELYFWTMVVAVAMFTLGGLASIIEGIYHVIRPEPLESPVGNYITLGIAFVFEGATLAYGLYQFEGEKKPDESMLEGVKHAKDPTTFMVIFEDTAAVAGVVVAFLAVFFAHKLQMPRLDGVGAIVVGLILATVAVILVREVQQLLVGERADPELLESVKSIAQEDDDVVRAEKPRSMHFGPETVMVTMDAQFKPDLRAADLARGIDRLHKSIREKHPDVKYIFIQPHDGGVEGNSNDETRSSNQVRMTKLE